MKEAPIYTRIGSNNLHPNSKSASMKFTRRTEWAGCVLSLFAVNHNTGVEGREFLRAIKGSNR